MTTTTFDTHKAAKTLTKAGVTDKQADAHVEVHMQVTESLATKKDLKNDLKQANNDLTLRVGGMLAGAVGLTVILLTFLDQVVFK